MKPQNGERLPSMQPLTAREEDILKGIDNFEHLLEGHTFLTALSDRAAQVKLLVTSRERLLLRGEQLFPLGGLALPGEGDAAEQAPAGQLF